MRDRDKNQVTLVLIRHGETQANKEHRYLGKTDEPLSESGRKMLLSYQKQNLYPDIDFLFTSPMRRCMETAEILYPNLCPILIPEWKEMDFGRFEYKNYEDLKENRQYQAWIDGGGTKAFPGGESREDFIRRCERGLLFMCTKLGQAAGEGKREPIRAGGVVHGGTIMALLSLREESRYFDYRVLNGRGYVCRVKGFRGSGASGKNSVEIRTVAKL